MGTHDFTLPRPGSGQTSPDTSGESAIYATAAERFAELHEQLTTIGDGHYVPPGLRIRIWTELQELVSADTTELEDLFPDIDIAPDVKRSEKSGLSTAEAKCAQLEASGDRPLTFCFGKVRRILELQELVRATIVWGDGCGIVFPDSVTGSRTVFSSYCATCQGLGHKRRGREIVQRVRLTLFDQRVPVAGGWRLNCRGCRERFFTATSQRRRCDRCQH